MKRIIVFGIFFILFFSSCEHETDWVVVSTYPKGEVKITQEYYLEDLDTVYIYRNILAKDGKIQLEGALEDEKREGLWKSYYPNGITWSETSFKNGIVDGETKTYYPNGKLRYSGNYEEGLKDGEWNWYDSTGVFIKTVEFHLEKEQ